MSTKVDGTYRGRARAARHLRGLAGTLLVLVPVAMVIATRSSPLFLAVVAVIAGAVAFLERRLPATAREIRRAFRTPLGTASLAFLAWALVSILWSSSRATTAFSLLEALLPAASAIIISFGLSGQLLYFTSRSASTGLALGLAVACIASIFDLITGMSLQRALGNRAQGFVLNRAIVTVLILAAPVLWWMARDRGLPRALHLLFGGLLVVTVVSSHSGAAALGAACGLLTYVLALYVPRLTLAALLTGLFVSFAGAPVVGEIMLRNLPKAAHERMVGGSSEARVAIWRSFEAVVRERPLLGWGYGVSSAITDDPRVHQIDPDKRALLGVGHPHNAALQIWVELGAVGAGLAFLFFGLLLRSISRLDPAIGAPRLALFAGASVVALVGHGAWQGWWIACLGLAAALFHIGSEHRENALAMHER